MNYLPLFLLITVVFIYLYMYLRREEIKRREHAVFISENLVSLQAGIDQVDRLKQKYCPDNERVTNLLSQALATRETITLAIAGRLGTLSTSDLYQLSSNLRESLLLVSGARQLVLAKMTPEQIEEEGYPD